MCIRLSTKLIYSMKILYLSCHSVLEFDEVSLFTDLGHQVFSMGSYMQPTAPHDPKRPPIVNGLNDKHLQDLYVASSKDNIHPDLIEWADTIIVMHKPEWIVLNWQKMKHKNVIWRTIGQSVTDVEDLLAIPRREGLKIVRYSPAEKRIPRYLGEDRIIRFYKKPEEYKDYNGNIPAVMTVSQSMKSRISAGGEDFCNFHIFDEATRGFERSLFGPHNEDSGIPGGELTYDELKAAYRNYRVYFYTGTYPASYTLNFIEAMMTGIPVVAIGPIRADINVFPGMNLYEVHEIIQSGENGYWSDEVGLLHALVDKLISHPEEAKAIGEKGRQRAIELFGYDTIKNNWKEFLDSL